MSLLKHIIIYSLLALLGITSLFSNNAIEVQDQMITVKGIITNEDGESLMGVAVVELENTVNGVASDKDGNFTIKIRKGSSIRFSTLGYTEQIIIIKNQEKLNVVLKEDRKLLDEVVVVGYGEQYRKDVTGSLGKMDLDKIIKVPVPNIDMALAGRVAGVQVSANDAQPGSEMNIIIRGSSSLTQSNAPLYVIDGFPMEDFNSASLNSADIASINILKDASATAIYGSRAANGVVIIETREGQIGKPVITYEGSYGIQQVTKTMDLMTPYQFVQYQLERSHDAMEDRYLTTPGLTLEDYRNMDHIDWQKHLFRLAPITMHNISVSGGNAQNRYLFSGSIVDQQGVVINSGIKKYQGRIKLNQWISESLNASINVSYSSDQNYGQINASQGLGSKAYATYLMYRTWGYRPVNIGVNDIYEDLFDENPEDDLSMAIMNPIVSSNNEIRKQKRDIMTANGVVDYHFLKNFKLSIRGGVNKRTIVDESFNNSNTYRGYPSPNNLRGVNAAYRSNTRFTWVNENILSYNNVFDKYHRVNAMAAITLQGEKNSIYGYSTINIPHESLGLSGMDDGVAAYPVANHSGNRLLSYLGRINYNYRSRYLLTASIRADGSSKFLSENRWGFFPSVAFAWRMNREKFMQNMEFVSESKVRISYGATGNNRIGNYDVYQSLGISDHYSFNNEIPQSALAILRLGDPDLRWEKTIQTDIGYDLSLFKERINIIVDFYDKRTSDLLLNAKIPYSSGRPSSYKNVGKVLNHGMEFTLNTVNIQHKDFTWETNFNISFNKSKVLSLADDQESILSLVTWTADWNGTYLYITRIGAPITAFYGYVWDGVYQYDDFDIIGSDTYNLKANVPTNGNVRSSIRPGDIKYVDQNGDGVVNDYDLVVIGNPLPKHIGGFGNTFRYKGLDLDVFFQWSYGNDIFNANRIMFEGNPTNQNINQFASYIDRWTPENQSNTQFRIGGQGPRGVYSSRTIEDGSYLRLKNIQLAYTLPKSWTNKIKTNEISVYVSANNVYTWTKYSGMDPEVSVRNTTLTPGFDYSAYPTSRTIMVGCRVSF